MGARDELDDRQAQACSTAAARCICAAEAVERSGAKLLREPVALVANVQFDDMARRLAGELYRARSVDERVVDEVGQGLLDANGVDLDLGADLAGVDVELTADTVGPAREPCGDVREEVSRRNHFEA
jgi:hypothetical protein